MNFPDCQVAAARQTGGVFGPVWDIIQIGGLSSTPVIKRFSSAIGVTADGQLVLAVNPDSNSLSVINTAAQQKAAEIPVTERDRAHFTQVVCVD